MKTVLLHGLGQSSASWEQVIETMENKEDILFPDLTRWMSNETPTYFELYQEFKKYCSEFTEPLNIAGLSLGGVLALQYTIEHPAKVNSLVLIGTQHTMPKNLLKIQNIIFRVIPNSFFGKTGFNKKGFISISNSLMDLNFFHELKSIRCPTYIICGSKDKANRSASRQLEEHILNSEYLLIANAGHEVNIDKPAVLGKMLNRFFRKNSYR